MQILRKLLPLLSVPGVSIEDPWTRGEVNFGQICGGPKLATSLKYGGVIGRPGAMDPNNFGKAPGQLPL